MLALSQDLSWLFAGIGDARNFFATLMCFLQAEPEQLENRVFHFTLIDLKPAAIAKILIMLHLLNQTRDIEAVSCVAYVFGSLIMPPFAYSKLQETVTTLISKLQTGVPLEDWICLAASQRKVILHHLRSWQNDLYGQYDTQSFREHGVAQALDTLLRENPRIQHPPFCEEDDLRFWRYGIVMTHEPGLLQHEEKLAQLIRDSERSPNIASTQAVLDYIDRDWKPNVTLVDVDWNNVQLREEPNSFPEFCFNPSRLADKLLRLDEGIAEQFGMSTSWSHFRQFFVAAALALDAIRPRLCVEVVVGEMNDCLERLQHDAWYTKGAKQGDLDPSQFLKTYNRIHMSNVP